MKKLFFILTTVVFFTSCSVDLQNNDLLPNIPVNKSINLELPQYINLQVPGGWVYTSGGIKGIILYNINGTEFKAFDRACPSNDCSTPMTFNGSTKLKCSCDDSEYSILNGSSQTNGNTFSAREYLVTRSSSSTLRISNF